MTLLDNADYRRFRSFDWKLSARGYAIRSRQTRPPPNKENETIFLHREILGLVRGDGHHTDHINHNRLDNRRANLRIVTNAENMLNKSVYRTNQSGYPGVHWHKGAKKWQAAPQRNGKRQYLGLFVTATDAAAAIAAAR